MPSHFLARLASVPPPAPIPPPSLAERNATDIADTVEFGQILDGLTIHATGVTREITSTVGRSATDSQEVCHIIAETCGLPLGEARSILAPIVADNDTAHRSIGQIAHQANVNRFARTLRRLEGGS